MAFNRLATCFQSVQVTHQDSKTGKVSSRSAYTKRINDTLQRISPNDIPYDTLQGLSSQGNLRNEVIKIIQGLATATKHNPLDVHSVMYISVEQKIIHDLSVLLNMPVLNNHYMDVMNSFPGIVMDGKSSTVVTRTRKDGRKAITGSVRNPSFKQLNVSPEALEAGVNTTAATPENQLIEQAAHNLAGKKWGVAINNAMSNMRGASRVSGTPVNYYGYTAPGGNPALIAARGLLENLEAIPLGRGGWRNSANRMKARAAFGSIESITTEGEQRAVTEKQRKEFRQIREQAKTRYGAFQKGSQMTTQEKEEARQDQRNREGRFLGDLFKGLKGILGRNPLIDVLKLLFLLLGKHHPVIAALGLTAATMLPSIMKLATTFARLIGGGALALGAASAFLGGGRARAVRGLAVKAVRGSRNIKGPLGWAARGLANSFYGGTRIGGNFVKNASQAVPDAVTSSRGMAATMLRNARGVQGPWRYLARPTATIAASAIGTGGKITGALAKNAGRLMGPFSGLLSFGLNKMAGQSTGEATTRAVSSTIFGVIGTAIAGPLGGMIGGLLGDWIGGKLFGLINNKADKQNQSLDKIDRNTSWLTKIANWIREKFNIADNSSIGAYGDVRPDAVSVRTLTAKEKAKMEKTYKYDLEMYNAVKNDSIAGWGKGGLDKARDILREKWKQEYVRKTMGPSLLGYKDMSEAQKLKYDTERATLLASPEAKKYAEDKLSDYLKNEGSRLSRLRASLDNSTVVDGMYGSVPDNISTEKINGVAAVNLHKLGLYGEIKGDSYANNFIGAGRIGRMKEADAIFRKHGVPYKITSTMGDSHAGGPKSHFLGNKIDVVPIGNIDEKTKRALEADFRRAGFYGGRTGAVGWHNAGSGYHWDLSLLRQEELKNMSATMKAATTETSSATSNITSSDGLRQSIAERVYGKDNALRKANEIIFTATDVTGSLGVWGITQVNNTGKMRI